MSNSISEVLLLRATPDACPHPHTVHLALGARVLIPHAPRVAQVIRLPPLYNIRAVSMWLWIDDQQDTNPCDARPHTRECTLRVSGPTPCTFPR